VIASSRITFYRPAAIRAGRTGSSAQTFKGTATIHCRGVPTRRIMVTITLDPVRAALIAPATFAAIRRASSCNRMAVRIAVACAASAACGASACAVFRAACATLPRSTAAPLGKL
jgi:hypothetical protein